MISLKLPSVTLQAVETEDSKITTDPHCFLEMNLTDIVTTVVVVQNQPPQFGLNLCFLCLFSLFVCFLCLFVFFVCLFSLFVCFLCFQTKKQKRFFSLKKTQTTKKKTNKNHTNKKKQQFQIFSAVNFININTKPVSNNCAFRGKIRAIT